MLRASLTGCMKMQIDVLLSRCKEHIMFRHYFCFVSDDVDFPASKKKKRQTLVWVFRSGYIMVPSKVRLFNLPMGVTYELRSYGTFD